MKKKVITVSLEYEQKRFQNGGTPELQHFIVGRNGEVWEAEKGQWGKEEEHQELVVMEAAAFSF